MDPSSYVLPSPDLFLLCSSETDAIFTLSTPYSFFFRYAERMPHSPFASLQTPRIGSAAEKFLQIWGQATRFTFVFFLGTKFSWLPNVLILF